MKFQCLIGWLATPICSLSAQISFFEGSPGRAGNVIVVGAAVERPLELQGVVLLPIECVGRTQLSELLDDQTRRRADVPGAARLLLPKEQGSLYKYRCDSQPGLTTYGYFVVGSDGVARGVFEIPAAGPPGNDDPLPNRVA